MAVSELYGFIKNRPSRYRKKILDKAYISERIILVIQGHLTAYDAMFSIIRRFGYPEFPLTPEMCDNIFQSFVVELFAESNPENDKFNKRKNVKPLGQLAVDLTVYCTSFLEDPQKGPLGLELIYSLPSLQIWGQVEEKYLEMKKDAHTIDTIGVGDWPLTLRSMTLPSSDYIFIQRGSKIISQTSSVLGNKLIERLELFKTLPAQAF